MAETNIEWTNATWNPIAGCDVVSPGCTNCYAMRRVAPRLAANPQTPHYHGTVKQSKAGPVWTGKIGIASDNKLTEPLRWKKPRMIFVNSTSDLFHPGVPVDVIDRIFAVMALCPQHTFQVLTKRPERMRWYVTRIMEGENGSEDIADAAGKMMEDGDSAADWVMNTDWPLPNVWLGTTVENQAEADQRIPHLLAVPASVRFLSVEPLLGPVDLRDMCDGWKHYDALSGKWLHDGDYPYFENGKPRIHWIIVGGESGPSFRPMNLDHARSLRDQCKVAGVPFFMKQMGGLRKPFPPIPDDLDIRQWPEVR